MHDGVDQGQVGEGLGEIAQVATTARLDLLRVEPQRAREREQLLAQLPRSLVLTDLRQRRHEPERAHHERAFVSVQSVVGLVRFVTQHQAVYRQHVVDCQHGCSDPRIVRREEPQQNHQQD